MRRAWAVLAAAAVMMAGAGVAVPAAQAATVDETYRVWHWNVAGWMMHRGSVTDGLVTAITASIRSRGFQFVSLNELCLSQYRAVQAALRGSGWPQDGGNFSRFEAHDDTSCGGEPFGVAIFSRAPLGAANRFPLADDGRVERRRLLCAPLLARPHLRFCTTHITPWEYVHNERQLGQVRSHLDAFHRAGDTVILAGDLNVQPHHGRLDTWYAPSLDTTQNGRNTGSYRELDDTDSRCPGYGEPTTQGNTDGLCGLASKIDMIFVRRERALAGYSADSLTIATTCGGPCSDHRIVIGTVTLRVTT